nr:hypothetical protein [Tanacetum cinerariifolium]
VQFIENEAKTGSIPSATSADDVTLPRRLTWDPHADVVVDEASRPGCLPNLTRLLTQPDYYSGGGSRWSATVDCRWPPLTAIDQWSGGGSSDGTGDS